jgi:DnaJ family protein B protein 12
MGAEALRSGNFPRAIKLLQKSLQLYPLPGVDALLSQTKARAQDASAPRSSQPSSSNTAPPPSPPQRATSTASSTASSNTQMGKDGRAYTQDQVAIVNQVLKSKEGGRGSHYRVLGNISQDSNETQIKKAYRKLSLKVHPDKNSAPHADEAFKAVGLAYGVLSDSQKRTIYDRYGEEDPDNRGGGGGGGMGGFAGRRGGGMHMHQGQDVSPEEIFNMFFGGGGMPGMHTGRGGGGVHFTSNGFGRQQRPRGQPRQQQQQQQEQQAPSLGMLFQFLPILLIMLVSFFKYDESAGVTGGVGGSMPGEGRYFSLTVRQSSCFLVVASVDVDWLYLMFVHWRVK